MKWRVDWSTYDCGYEIIEAGTAKEAREIFRDMTRDNPVTIDGISKGEEYAPVDENEWNGKWSD